MQLILEGLILYLVSGNYLVTITVAQPKYLVQSYLFATTSLALEVNLKLLVKTPNWEQAVLLLFSHCADTATLSYAVIKIEIIMSSFASESVLLCCF